MTECTCGKVRFWTRRIARRHIRTHYRAERGLRAYRCPGGHWHVGHIPQAVAAGVATAREVYR